MSRRHPGRRQTVARRARSTSRSRSRSDGLRVLGFTADLGRFGHRDGTRASQFSAVNIGPQWSPGTLDARQIFLRLAAGLLLELVGCHPLLVDEDALPLGAGLVLGHVEKGGDRLAPDLHDVAQPSAGLDVGLVREMKLLLLLSQAGRLWLCLAHTAHHLERIRDLGGEWRVGRMWSVWRSHSDVDWRFTAGHRGRGRVANSLRLEVGLDRRAGGHTGGGRQARHGRHRAGRTRVGG